MLISSASLDEINALKAAIQSKEGTNSAHQVQIALQATKEMLALQVILSRGRKVGILIKVR